MGDAGNSCKYNLFINDSGCRIIKDALSQWEPVSETCLLLEVNTHSQDIYCTSVFWNMSPRVMLCLGTCCAERGGGGVGDSEGWRGFFWLLW